MSDDERWIAQRPGTREFLHWSLPIAANPRDELCGAGALSFTVAPEMASLVAPDGLLMFDAWGTLLHQEQAGQITWSGLVVDGSWEGPTWRVEAAGVSTYPHGQVFDGSFRGAGLDPADIYRMLWGHLQGYPDGDLGVTVVGSTSRRLGSDSDVRRDAAKAVEAQAKTALDAAKKALADARKARAGDSVIASLTATVATRQQALDAAKTERERLDDLVREDGGSYALHWWDSPDVGRELERVADEANVEWIERHRWNDEMTDIVHEILVADRIGSRRVDLLFQQGINVDLVPFDQNGDAYASEMLGLGRGEGKDALRSRIATRRAGRLRRARVLASTKDIGSQKRLDAVTRAEHTRRQRLLSTTQIVVHDHPHAPFGSFDRGDEIRIDADAAWLELTSVWQRIVARERISPTRMLLELEPADH